MISIPEKYKNSLKNFTFIDLFCGIGAFRLALSSFGAECVYSIDIDKHASKVYLENYGVNPLGDIRQIKAEDIPQHDILCAGFPCQSFSISGKQLGFNDTRGTLFFDIIRIVQKHKPKIIFLENVSNLKNHDKGNTYRTIHDSLTNLGYAVHDKVLNSSKYGIPQSRKRIYIVCFRNDIDYSDFEFPNEQSIMTSMGDILLDNEECIQFNISKTPQINQEIINNPPYNTQKPIRVGIVNKGGQGDRIYYSKGHSITLSASSGGTGSKTGLYYIDGVIRKLHPRETARLMGFPDTFKYDNSVTQAHKQFGNSIVINVLQYITIQIVKSFIFKETDEKSHNSFNKNRIVNGSKIAKDGFLNEDYVINSFKSLSDESTTWLNSMGFDTDKAKIIDVQKIHGHKSDIQLTIKENNKFYLENIQIKLVSQHSGYNQIDKRWLNKYVDIWNIPPDISRLLKLFSGELKPDIFNPKDTRRMFINEFSKDNQQKIIDFFNNNKKLILYDILKGSDEYHAKWILVIKKHDNESIIVSTDDLIEYYMTLDFTVTVNGNLKIGDITMQRKGGDNGKITANMIQFKSNPSKYFKIFN